MGVAGRVGVSRADATEAAVTDLGRVVPVRLPGPAPEHDAQRACAPALGACTPSAPAVPAPPGGDGIGRALTAASMLHLAVFAGLWAQPANGIGGSEQPLETISVEIVMLPAMPVASAVAPSSPAVATPPKPVKEPPQPEKDSQAVLVERDAPQTDAVLPPTPSEEAAHQRDGEVAPKPEASETRPPEPDVPAAPAAASSSSASQPDVRATPAPSASPGELRRFSRDVARALARTPPKTVRRTGTVIVSFTVGADGAVEDAAIRRSSGQAVLDDAALAAVHRASLPKPPAGANARQRRFEIPYHFRRRS